MNALDSPLDALTVNYLSFGFFTVVNNLWTWVAVITAAVSFWKMRASGPSILPPAELCHDGISKGSASVSDQVLSPARTATTEHKDIEQRKALPEEAAPVNFQVDGDDFDADTVTKGKFTLYYYEENTAGTCSETMTMDKEEKLMEEQLEQSAEGESEFIYRFDESAEWWERMLRVRRGDNSWNRCQDLTVFNGNVVRLWDWHVRSSGTSNMIRDDSRYVVC